MTKLTQILSQLEQGESGSASQLLSLVYNELHHMAAKKLSREPPGQTLSATALVHEAYLRLFGTSQAPNWKSRRHFFAAAAQAMRCILVDNARRKGSQKRGGTFHRRDFNASDIVAPALSDDVLAVDEALTKLSTIDKELAELVQLRCFAGLTIPEIARVMAISPRSADRLWAYPVRGFTKKFGLNDRCRHLLVIVARSLVQLRIDSIGSVLCTASLDPLPTGVYGVLIRAFETRKDVVACRLR